MNIFGIFSCIPINMLTNETNRKNVVINAFIIGYIYCCFNSEVNSEVKKREIILPLKAVKLLLLAMQVMVFQH